MPDLTSENEAHVCRFKKMIENELVRAIMPALVTSNFDEDSIKNECASMETPFSHYSSIGNILDLKGS